MIQTFFKKKNTRKLAQSAKRVFKFNITSKSTNVPLFFVHIPKTAGTSFRKSLESLQPIEKDYGTKASETTALVRTYIYEELEPYKLKHLMLTRQFSLTGHTHIQKYADFFNTRNIITFVREPIAQIVSHYNHFVTHYKFTGSFERFYRSMPFQNVQAKYLKGFPITLIGFTGITEHYDDSLTLITSNLKLNIPSLKQNIAAKSHQNKEALTKDVVDELTKLNQDDFRLYQQALDLHHQRITLFKQKNFWAHIHATVNKNDVLHGCAFFAEHDEAVEIQVRINGEARERIIARDFFDMFPKFNFPRQRYIGFHLSLSKWISTGQSEIKLVVCKTGQIYTVGFPE